MAKTTPARGEVTVNQTVVGSILSAKESKLNEGELSGVIVASVLGAIALLMLLSVCFFRTRKQKGKEDLSMHFDNLTYTVRSMISSQPRMSRHERSLNNQVPTGSQNVYADPIACTTCQAKLPNVSVIPKESGHYAEITDQKMVDKLNVYLPKYDNNEYEKCNITKSKLGVTDSPQYLDVCTGADSKAVYESVSENEAECNAMNEQLETSKNQYDECGNVDVPDNAPSHYIDLDDAVGNGESADSTSLRLELEPGVYEDLNNVNGQPSSLDDILVNCDGDLDLAKAPSDEKHCS
ncbi:Hypothetical predicted protein [Mytilus galloprovincialis]|uniref:Uncharacterized protein n=1 Tax=Mytilus galloprovincialis TaxID=29158 RepID=A0A8B6CYJ1_MYTGA|nr:Hypothetical predicted protein [Mytilus galloprovincialis]